MLEIGGAKVFSLYPCSIDGLRVSKDVGIRNKMKTQGDNEH